MATITGLTAERMLEIEAASIVDGDVVAGNLILTRHDGTPINAGSVVGPQGIQGNVGPAAATDGWNAMAQTLTFGAADAPNYTVTLPGDLTATYFPGQRIKLTHAAAVKYFIVMKAAHAAGTTTLTLYGGTDYTLAAGAITLPYYSVAKAPAGFPLNPAKWTVQTRDITLRTQASPAIDTFYNLGSLSIVIPIGQWRVSYQANADARDTSRDETFTQITLSTGNNTESDADFTSAIMSRQNLAGNIVLAGTLYRAKILDLAAKTTYYLNLCSRVSALDSLNIYGTYSPTLIRAECAYL